MILGIDHILIAVEDLDKATELYRRLGFQVLVGGEHPTVGTHNALVPLADGTYLELIGVKKPELAQQFPFGQQVLEALDRPNRLAGFALESGDVNGDVQAIRDRGLTIAKAPPGGRARPDGQQVSWRTAHPEDPRLPFLIQDTTPRSLRVPPSPDGLNGSTQVGWVEIGAADLQPATTSFTQLLGERPVEGKFSLQRGAIHLSQSFSGDGAQMAALLTQDVAGLARDWEARGVLFYDEVIRGNGRVLVPRDTGGARISFCQIR
ncbi:MAG: VOC family protein [Nitrospirae bacterium]|nr:MAG: VOC family protein [Nitrospirota bacterium]